MSNWKQSVSVGIIMAFYSIVLAVPVVLVPVLAYIEAGWVGLARLAACYLFVAGVVAALGFAMKHIDDGRDR